VEALSDVLSSGLIVALGDLFKLIFIAYFMFTLNWGLAVVTLLVMPLMVWVTFWFRNNVREQYRETRKQVSRLNSFIQEHVTGMHIVQLFNREEEEMDRFESINDDHRAAHLQTIFYYAIFWPSIEIISNVALGAVLWYGGLQAMAGSALTLGVLVAFIQYARQFFEPIRDLSNQYDTLQRAMAGAERIFGVLDEDHRLAEPDEPVELGEVEGKIEFRNVWFAYEDDNEGNPDWVLKDVSFTVEPGETVAIVGATGAGKSTVMNLLLRFYEIQRGDIFVDGVNIRDLRLTDLRRHIGLVLQDVFLFSGSVERNLTLNDPDVDEAKMKRAAEVVQADQFIERLPEGYQQDVKERGSSLSHGQRQLLAFVRALLYNPDVMVLDEATSSVDTETETLIQQALERLTEGRTTLAIAHRLSTIQDADEILVLHKGEVRERGTHQELLAQDGLYRKLYDLQYADQSGLLSGSASGDGEPPEEEVRA
jgi:ATP-binding cassette subfamily B protein